MHGRQIGMGHAACRQKAMGLHHRSDGQPPLLVEEMSAITTSMLIMRLPAHASSANPLLRRTVGPIG
jgi:hypothetical protein